MAATAILNLSTRCWEKPENLSTKHQDKVQVTHIDFKLQQHQCQYCKSAEKTQYYIDIPTKGINEHVRKLFIHNFTSVGQKRTGV